MTSRERVWQAMSLQKPDRVPVMCQMSIGHMLLQLNGSAMEFWLDEETFAEGLLRLREQYDFDGILVSLHGHDPDWRKSTISTTPDGADIIADFGTCRMRFQPDRLPDVEYNEHRIKPLIEELAVADLPEEIDYIPVTQGLYFHIHPENRFGIFERLAAAIEGRYSLHGEITSPFDYLLDLLGHESALMALIVHPEKSKAILAHFTRGLVALVQGMCQTDIDAVKISSPFAGMGFISPQFYEEFVFPYEAELIAIIRRTGKHAYLHTCGAIGDRLELMVQSGASGIECLDPPPLGNVELARAVDQIGGNMFIKGNLDSVNILLQGAEAEVRSTIRQTTHEGMRAKGFILSTACSIAPHVSPERVRLISEIAHEVGYY